MYICTTVTVDILLQKLCLRHFGNQVHACTTTYNNNNIATTIACNIYMHAQNCTLELEASHPGMMLSSRGCLYTYARTPIHTCMHAGMHTNKHIHTVKPIAAMQNIITTQQTSSAHSHSRKMLLDTTSNVQEDCPDQRTKPEVLLCPHAPKPESTVGHLLSYVVNH